jgi:FlaA1/EpsC-like NDP-sugar epimerase
MDILTGQRLLITGGTGSLGKTLLRRVLSGEAGTPAKITIFSRDEEKQHALRVMYMNKNVATDEVLYDNFRRLIDFRIGDVRLLESLAPALAQADLVVNAAAMKQVPACEYFPEEAVATNIKGPENIVRAIRDFRLPVKTVVGISTDKACKPVNVMGMTKAIQERIFLRANLDVPDTRFIAVRYGNVLASRGSAIPLFHEQIRNGGPVTITHPDMTRFLLSLDQAVDIIFEAVASARRGEIHIPIVPSARVVDVASVLIGKRPIKTVITGIRPGEKIDEMLISEEEAHRAFRRDNHYVIPSMLPELEGEGSPKAIGKPYSSGDEPMNREGALELLTKNRLLVEDVQGELKELLR